MEGSDALPSLLIDSLLAQFRAGNSQWKLRKPKEKRLKVARRADGTILVRALAVDR